MLNRRWLLAALAATGLAAADVATAAAPVRVASKMDTEGELLGSMIIQLLNAKGIPTVSKLRLGNTKVTRSALLSGEVDIYPEYTGNGAFFFSIDTDPVWKSAKDGYERVRKLDADANKITWLPAAPANNTWAMAVRQDVATANKLATLDDFAAWSKTGGTVKLAASAEFVESPAALPAFQKAYGFKLSQDQLLVLAGGDTAGTERAAAEGTSGVNTAMVYGTDGAIAALKLVVLEDTKNAQMVYEPAPIVRSAVLADYPAIPGILAPAFAQLDGATLRSLNAKVSVDGEDAGKVAAAWLASKGLTK